jgi:hypothetical protein
MMNTLNHTAYIKVQIAPPPPPPPSPSSLQKKEEEESSSLGGLVASLTSGLGVLSFMLMLIVAYIVVLCWKEVKKS